MPIKIEEFKPGEVYYVGTDGGLLNKLPFASQLTCLRVGKRDIFFQTGAHREVKYTRQECARFTFLSEEETQTLNILREMYRILSDRDFPGIGRISPLRLPSREVVMKIHDCVFALLKALAPLQEKKEEE